MRSPLNKPPLFSVIIPIFNRAKSLGYALESVFAQTCQDFEVIVVDDGSRAEVAAKIKSLLESFADHRVRLFTHAQNKNGAAARNTGIKAAKGEFICFLDSDDTWLPAKLECVAANIQNFPDRQAFLIHHQYCNSRNGEKSIALPTKAKLDRESVAHYSFVTNNVGGIQSSTICVPTEMAKKALFDERCRGHQDWDFALQVGALTDDFRFIQELLTIRGKNSLDSVADGLDWKYSLWFYALKADYFDVQSARYYFQRVILRKALLAFELFPLLSSKLCRKLFVSSPINTLQILSSFFVKVRGQKRRLNHVKAHCEKIGAQKIIIFGANDYAKFLMMNTSKSIEILKIIDSNIELTKKQLFGITIESISTIPITDLDASEVVVLATDRHQQSMKAQLMSISPDNIGKVVEF